MRRSKELDTKRGRNVPRALLRRVGYLLGRWSNALLREDRDDRLSADSKKTSSSSDADAMQGMAGTVRAGPPADWLARVSPHPPPAAWLEQVQGKTFLSQTVNQRDEMDGVPQTPFTTEASQTLTTLPPQAVAENSLPRSDELTPAARGSATARGNPVRSVRDPTGISPRGSAPIKAEDAQPVQSNETTIDLVPASNSSLDAASIEPAGKTVQPPFVELSHAQAEPVVEEVVSEHPLNASPDGLAPEPIRQRAPIHPSPQPPVIQRDGTEQAVPDQDFPPGWAGLFMFEDVSRNPVTKPLAVQPLTEFPSALSALEQEIPTRLDVFVPEWGQAAKRREPARVIVQTESVWVAPREGWVPLPNDEGEPQDSEQARREWERRVRLDREQRGS
jgi:hypothetical protein